MNHDQKTIESLGALFAAPWEGIVFRHMFGVCSPERENRSGARWNPPEVPAIYLSLERSTAIAEGDYAISLQTVPPDAHRRVHRIAIAACSVLDLSLWDTLKGFGVGPALFKSNDYTLTQAIGGAVEWLEHDGLLVPSARHDGINIVLFTRHRSEKCKFNLVDYEDLPSVGKTGR